MCIQQQFLFKETVLQKVMNKISLTFSKSLEKYVWIISFLESVTLLKMTLSIFQEFCFKVSEDFFYGTPPCMFLFS